MNIRTRAKRAMRDRSFHYVYASGYKLRKNKRYEFRAIHPAYGILFSGWFIADSNNPVVHVL